jgi:hypothetical protein
VTAQVRVRVSGKQRPTADIQLLVRIVLALAEQLQDEERAQRDVQDEAAPSSEARAA